MAKREISENPTNVSANQNTAFDKGSVSKQKHKRAKPLG